MGGWGMKGVDTIARIHPRAADVYAEKVAKLEIALAKGKQKFDKRATEKERDWSRQKQRLMRQR